MTARMLHRIRVSGYKSIGEADIKLNALNLLIGANGVGKSNFISLFKLMHDLANIRLQLHTGKAGGANALLHFGRKQTQELKLELLLGDNPQMTYASTLLADEDDSLIFARESICVKDTDHKELEYNVGLFGGHRESRLFDNNGTAESAVSEDIVNAMRSFLTYHFHDTSRDAKVKQSCHLHDNRELKSDASNLAAFLFLIKNRHENRYRQIIETMQMVAPFIEDLVLKPLALTPDKIRLEWKDRNCDDVFGAGALSDGTLRFLCLVTLLLQPHPPRIVLLDEPELGLHPSAITLLASLLKSASCHSQIVVSTQSVTLINHFPPQDIMIVEREGGQSVFKRLQKEQLDIWLDEFAMGDLWEKNLIGGRP